MSHTVHQNEYHIFYFYTYELRYVFQEGKTPLHIALGNVHLSSWIVRKLLEHDSDVNKQDNVSLEFLDILIQCTTIH